ncbi:protein ENHANCED DISEASE RESISTANCE 2-like isoform X2 [Diospyros lotus]|uniref:protein ENHANCED DISEASE RESISTANCE 2-like isoform X2 n=1 Tax=Diospyros lotus TaxID=55363 RepID=UPI00224D9F8A|nr:protein ENHANCED DISEASE RESISTANCE 2-like isoform X2 [Diospyros lotus]
MGIPQADGKMEGWLYLIRPSRFGLQNSRKRYFVLEDNCLKSFKSKPISDKEESIRSAIIDSCIRVTDNGRESYHGKVFFTFSLCNTSNHNDQLKCGASRPEEAARWIRSLQDAALNPTKNFVACSKRKWQPFRLTVSKRSARKNSVDWTSSSCMHMDAMTSDVIAPSPWKIFGCQNGLRMFKEAKDNDFGGRHWDDHPAIMAVGVVDGTSEAVFRTLMSLGPSRSDVVEHLDGHTDIVHMQLWNDWLPWGMRRRDFLIRRYWRREDDGTYVILFHSVFHRKCPPQHSYVRATLKSGGFVVTPINHGKKSVVKHMLAIDWKFWRSYLRKGSARSITICMLGRVAALSELYRAKAGDYSSSEFSFVEKTKDIGLQSEKANINIEVANPEELIAIEDNKKEDDPENTASGNSSLRGLNDAGDEFFDVPEPSSDDDQLENDWCSDQNLHYPEVHHTRLSSAAGFVKKLHGLATQKKGYVDLQEAAWEENVPSCCYGATLAKDPTCNMPCSWTTADPSAFLIRGENYLRDRHKIKAKGTLMQMVGADWLRSDKREDDLGSRPGGIVQKYAANGGPEFFLVVNIQVPGSTTYGLALYFMTKTPLHETPLLESFVNGDDAYRNSRFKLIPYISQGSWIVKQSVGKKACLIGQALEVNYHRGKNYLELGIDVGSSTVARGVVNLVLGYLNNLVIELAFLIQANTQDELPECLLGTCRFNHLDASKTVVVTP